MSQRGPKSPWVVAFWVVAFSAVAFCGWLVGLLTEWLAARL